MVKKDHFFRKNFNQELLLVKEKLYFFPSVKQIIFIIKNVFKSATENYSEYSSYMKNDSKVYSIFIRKNETVIF
jgi:hypothetical protein